VFDAAGRLKGFRGTGADITAKRQAEERIQFLATRDSLTGLPNRLLLGDRADQAILNAGRHAGRIAVLSIQLDRFQRVSDSLGHQVGDAVLRAVAERLSRTLRRDDTLARLAGDEFVLLWDGTREIDDVAVVAQKVLNCLAAPVVVEEHALNVSASIGISVFPGDGGDFVELLKNADAARQAAREADGNAYRFFSRELNTRALERLELENDLHRALARDEFVLGYQPVLSSATGRVVGAEVQMRWQHPTRGLLAPEAFIPLAQQTGLMGALGTWLIENTCLQVGRWCAPHLAGLWFALNVSIKEFARDRTFAQALERELQAGRIEPSRLILEIASQNVERGGGEYLDTLRAIAGSGVSLTIDDFGTGQFNLVALRQLPVRKLKIDRSLVAELATREDAAIIVQTLAAMAKGLGLTFAAQGVETAAQLSRLQALGCDEWQGPLQGEPLDAAAFETLLAPLPRAASA
jgi:diguanylate cyclase (GGDEF)-like protein